MNLWQRFCLSLTSGNTFRKRASRQPYFWKHSEEAGSGIPDVAFPGQYVVLEKERQRQDTINAIKKKFGRDSLLQSGPTSRSNCSTEVLNWDIVVEKNQWSPRQGFSPAEEDGAKEVFTRRHGHPRMSQANRAKIFMPFDALKGLRGFSRKRTRSSRPYKDFHDLPHWS